MRFSLHGQGGLGSRGSTDGSAPGLSFSSPLELVTPADDLLGLRAWDGAADAVPRDGRNASELLAFPPAMPTGVETERSEPPVASLTRRSCAACSSTGR